MTKAKRKPTMTKGQFTEQLSLPVEVELINDLDRFSNGWIQMSLTEVTIREGGKEIGRITVDMGGMTVAGQIGRRTWTISVKQLWQLFAQADENYLNAAEGIRSKPPKS